MLEVLNILNADVTNGNKNYCMISEEQLNAIKEFAKREDKEKQNLQQRIDLAKKLLKKYIGILDDVADSYFENVLSILQDEEVKYNV